MEAWENVIGRAKPPAPGTPFVQGGRGTAVVEWGGTWSGRPLHAVISHIVIEARQDGGDWRVVGAMPSGVGDMAQTVALEAGDYEFRLLGVGYDGVPGEPSGTSSATIYGLGGEDGEDFYEELDGMRDDLTALEDNYTALDDDVTALDDHLAQLEDGIYGPDGLNDDLIGLEDDLHGPGGFGDGLTGLHDDIHGPGGLGEDVAGLQGGVGELGSQMEDIRGEMANLDAENDRLQDQIDGINDTLSDHDSRISAVEDCCANCDCNGNGGDDPGDPGDPGNGDDGPQPIEHLRGDRLGYLHHSASTGRNILRQGSDSNRFAGEGGETVVVTTSSFNRIQPVGSWTRFDGPMVNDRSARAVSIFARYFAEGELVTFEYTRDEEFDAYTGVGRSQRSVLTNHIFKNVEEVRALPSSYTGSLSYTRETDPGYQQIALDIGVGPGNGNYRFMGSSKTYLEPGYEAHRTGTTSVHGWDSSHYSDNDQYGGGSLVIMNRMVTESSQELKHLIRPGMVFGDDFDVINFTWTAIELVAHPDVR